MAADALCGGSPPCAHVADWIGWRGNCSGDFENSGTNPLAGSRACAADLFWAQQGGPGRVLTGEIESAYARLLVDLRSSFSEGWIGPSPVIFAPLAAGTYTGQVVVFSAPEAKSTSSIVTPMFP